MDYNFSGVCVNSIADFEKKTKKIKADFLDQVINFVDVLNREDVKSCMGEIHTEINTLFDDEFRKFLLSFTGCMNKVQAVLEKYM